LSWIDHLIGSEQHGPWDRYAERFGSLEIDHQFHAGRQLDRDVGGLGALQNLMS
jgi:hypothetical protein